MKELKVLAINGSPHGEGGTFQAINIVAKELEKQGIKTEILHKLGIRIIHIENKTLWNTPDFVLEVIRQELNSTKAD